MTTTTTQNRLSVIVASAAALLVLLVPTAEAAPDRGALFMAGQLALQRGDHDTAVRRFEAHWRMAHRSEGDAWQASLALAAAHESQGDRSAAIAALRRFVDHARRSGWQGDAARAHRRRAEELIVELRIADGLLQAYRGVRQAVSWRPEGRAAGPSRATLRGSHAAGVVLERVAGPGWSAMIWMALRSSAAPTSVASQPGTPPSDG